MKSIRYLGSVNREDQKFLDEYRAIRRSEGRSGGSVEWYRSLPDVPSNDPRHREWELRKESLLWLRSYLTRVPAVSSLDGRAVLDAGAGNCWLSRHLSEWGFRVTALDINDDAEDGLGVAPYYLEELNLEITRICSTFEPWPSTLGLFDHILFNGSLHYAENPEAVIAEGVRNLKDGGSIIILDSPLYRRASSGRKMIRERGGPERGAFLTRDMLNRIGSLDGVTCDVYERPRSLRTMVSRLKSYVVLRREPAAMPWIVVRAS